MIKFFKKFEKHRQKEVIKLVIVKPGSETIRSFLFM